MAPLLDNTNKRIIGMRDPDNNLLYGMKDHNDVEFFRKPALTKVHTITTTLKIEPTGMDLYGDLFYIGSNDTTSNLNTPPFGHGGEVYAVNKTTGASVGTVHRTRVNHYIRNGLAVSRDSFWTMHTALHLSFTRRGGEINFGSTEVGIDVHRRPGISVDVNRFFHQEINLEEIFLRGRGHLNFHGLRSRCAIIESQRDFYFTCKIFVPPATIPTGYEFNPDEHIFIGGITIDDLNRTFIDGATEPVRVPDIPW